MRVAVFPSSTAGARSAAPMVVRAAEVAVSDHPVGKTGLRVQVWRTPHLGTPALYLYFLITGPGG